MLRGNARLAILDEPFRGLDRQQRRTLLARCRERWKNATLLCITHDVGETLEFDRVLVIESGQVIEDGVPIELAKRTDSRYSQMLEAEDAVREKLWSSKRWRKVWLGTQPAVEGENLVR
jgi:ATP-binding cassette subfamily B protein